MTAQYHIKCSPGAMATVQGKPVTLVEVRSFTGRQVDSDSSAFYEKNLTSLFSITIDQDEHGLTKIRGVTVLTPSRAEMEVYTEIRSDQEVYIESLINLNNHIVILF